MTSKKLKHKESEMLKTLIFISRKKTREKTSEFVVELSKIEEKDKIICHVLNQSSFEFSALFVTMSKLSY